MSLKQKKAIIRRFMQTAYTDGKLVELLEHARSGKLSFYSCCCFIGIPTADHELRGQMEYVLVDKSPHYFQARTWDGAENAEYAYYKLAPLGDRSSRSEEHRLRLLIPMVKAEIRRRMKQGEHPSVETGVEVGA